MKRLLFAIIGMFLFTSPAFAQSACSSIAYGAVLTAGQWNSCFSAKQDALGYTPVNRAGDTMQGRLLFTGSGTTAFSNAIAATCTDACNDSVGRFTLGATPNTLFAVNFSAAWTNPPICFAQDETHSVTMRVSTATTTVVTFTASGSMTASDHISYSCTGAY